MLSELRVENLLLIERAELRLVAGLNVLTGETGAGKTVLAHALDLLLGGRARAGIVRPGASEAYVEGVFEPPPTLPKALRERLPSDSEEIVLARRVGADGRTRAILNGRAATVAELRDLGGALMSFYGQHEHRKLTIAAAQLELLDRICGAEQAERLRACAGAFAETRRLRQELERWQELAGARERELDLLDFELNEIDAAEADLLEHEELRGRRERLRRLDALCSAAAGAADALAPESADESGVTTRLAGATARIDALAGVDPELDRLGERMRAISIEAQELASELHAYVETASSSELAGGELPLEEIEERLGTVERLMRKHGGSVESVQAHAARSRARHDQLAGASDALASTDEELREAENVLAGHVLALRAARAKAAPRLAEAVRAQLGSLAMPDACFEVALSEREEAGPSGADVAEFLISANPGVAPGPVREIASGGELSRVMLALATVGESSAGGSRRRGSTERDGTTLIFDEIDAGIGGRAARTVGARLHELAQARQVLCITHLPQIASRADRHFSIVKKTADALARADVVQLSERDVVPELVRMLGADAGDSAARKHAHDLRRAA